MRERVQAKDLKVGQISYLPYFGHLRKAKITHVGATHRGNLSAKTFVTLTYEVFCEGKPTHRNQTSTWTERWYEIYVRPPKKKK